MNNYLEILKIASISFPFIALIISIPFILIEYHKFGSISFLRSIIIYSLILYLMCSYFLVVLPLPKIDEVAKLTTPTMQLIPFSFLIDFINHTSLDIANIHTYIKAIKESYFYVPIFNILITLPFGIYLRYFFKCNIKKTIIYTFLLSLFFELTQLSGLYFIYPRGYRLFDVDDLFLNTLGGVIGYYISTPLIKILPKREEIDNKALERGKVISGFRRSTAFFFDIFIFSILSSLVSFINFKYTTIIVAIIYYFIIPIILNSTLGEKFLNIKIVDNTNKNNKLRLIFRNILFTIIYIVIPYITSSIINDINNDYIKEFIGLILIGLIFIIYSISGIKYLFTNKKMIYERISKTQMISTIKIKEH